MRTLFSVVREGVKTLVTILLLLIVIIFGRDSFLYFCLIPLSLIIIIWGWGNFKKEWESLKKLINEIIVDIKHLN